MEKEFSLKLQVDFILNELGFQLPLSITQADQVVTMLVNGLANLPFDNRNSDSLQAQILHYLRTGPNSNEEVSIEKDTTSKTIKFPKNFR